MKKKNKLDAQRQYMVIGTLALLSISFMFFVNFDVNRAAAPKGTEGDLKTMLTFTLATMEVIELET